MSKTNKPDKDFAAIFDAFLQAFADDKAEALRSISTASKKPTNTDTKPVTKKPVKKLAAASKQPKSGKPAKKLASISKKPKPQKIVSKTAAKKKPALKKVANPPAKKAITPVGATRSVKVKKPAAKNLVLKKPILKKKLTAKKNNA